MTSYSENNKRILKNTGMLYIRMIFIVVVNLYTSRVILDAIGVEDFGIYNLVGGVVVLLSFLSSALTSATQRFLTFELSNNEITGFQKVFSLSLLIYLGLALIIVLLLETIGVWFLNSWLQIPSERMCAANWVYQFTLISFIFSVLRTPYSAAVIAYERMSFFAYISIVDVILKLLIVYILIVFPFDKLLIYSVLVSVATLVINLLYYFWCVIKLNGCRFFYNWDYSLFKRLLNFSSWSLLGSFSVVATNQGVNMVLNIFFGVVVNAAMGIANQVNAVAGQLLSGFQTAFNPQIVKYYATNDKDGLLSLIYRSSKFSYFLLMLVSIPLLFEMPKLLFLWLREVPQYTIEFCRLMLIASLFESLSGPLWMVIQATGRIRKYQLFVSSLFLLNLLLPCVLFSFGFPPVVAFIIRILIAVLLLYYRIWYLNKNIKMPLIQKHFFSKVIYPGVRVTFFSCIIPFILYFCFENTSRFILILVVSVFSSLLCIYFGGLTLEERRYVCNIINSKLIKKNKI